MLCRHCKKRPATRSRRLCGRCYYAPGVRLRYPDMRSKFNRRGRGFVPLSQQLPHGEPTAALPGTKARVAAIVKRCKLGRPLFNPQDAERDLA